MRRWVLFGYFLFNIVDEMLMILLWLIMNEIKLKFCILEMFINFICFLFYRVYFE